MGGAVGVAGRPLRRPGMPVRAGLVLEVRLRPEALRAGGVEGDRAVTIDAKRILFEDPFLIAVDKPPGLPTQPTVDPARPSLYRLVEELLRRRAGADVYLGLHQRLDRDTSGVVLFTKAREANPALAALFAERRVEKTYLAIVARPRRLPRREWTARADVNGVSARTEFRLREVLPAALLVEARPATGRKHQIRVHLAAGGMPILGDALHGSGGSAREAPRLMLHACRLAFRHPISGRELAIESPLPSDFVETLRASSSRAQRGIG